jgi:hypothetical protein
MGGRSRLVRAPKRVSTLPFSLLPRFVGPTASADKERSMEDTCPTYSRTQWHGLEHRDTKGQGFNEDSIRFGHKRRGAETRWQWKKGRSLTPRLSVPVPLFVCVTRVDMLSVLWPSSKTREEDQYEYCIWRSERTVSDKLHETHTKCPKF